MSERERDREHETFEFILEIESDYINKTDRSGFSSIVTLCRLSVSSVVYYFFCMGAYAAAACCRLCIPLKPPFLFSAFFC